MDIDPKKNAAEEAVKLVQDGMIVGLGTGSTAYWAIERLGERVQEGLRIQTVATSKRSEAQARELGIPILPLEDIERIDLTIDGADEADGDRNLIKGGGGALLREKIIAAHSKRLVIVADESKTVETLGQFPLPVEIVPFGANLTMLRLAALLGHPRLRMDGDRPYVTDNGNWIADCRFGTIADPAGLERELNLIPGVVENGLFIGMAAAVYVGHADGSVSVR
nr:ribose-5-phosphate isomerase RpiA [Cohnella sp. REN36]